MACGDVLRAAFVGAAVVFSASGAWAQAAAERQPSAAQAVQQERMRACNAGAGSRDLGGDARKTFMSDCLAGRTDPNAPAAGGGRSAAQAAQQDRMRSCNAEAGTRNLAGDARKGFMSDCLAGRSATGADAAGANAAAAAAARSGGGSGAGAGAAPAPTSRSGGPAARN